MNWQKVDARWEKRKTVAPGGELESGVTYQIERWDIPGEAPLEVRACTRQGHPMESFCSPHETEKTSIVLHHTSGYGNFAGLMGGDGGPHKASIHFLVGRDGNVYQIVKSELVAWHATWWNDNSIGIEIDNIGSLRKDGNNLHSEYGKNDVYCTLDDKGVYVEKEWPGHGEKYWAAWTEAQYVGLGKLLKALCHKHKIPAHIPPDPARFKPFKRPDDRKRFQGICTHYQIDPERRDDLGPYVDWEKMLRYGAITESDCFSGKPYTRPPTEQVGTPYASATGSAGHGLSNARFGNQKMKPGDELEMLVDATGKNGREVKFVLELRDAQGKEWKNAGEVKAKIASGTAKGKLAPPEHGSREKVALRFHTELLPGEGDPLPGDKDPQATPPTPPSVAQQTTQHHEELPPAQQLSRTTVRVNVGHRAGRIAFTLRKPGEPLPVAPAPGEPAGPAAAGKRNDFVQAALNLVGTHYAKGSARPEQGLDGPGLVSVCLARVGLCEKDKPLDASTLYAKYPFHGGTHLDVPADIVPGDLAWFGRGDHDHDAQQHCMIFLGGDRVLGPIPDGGPKDGAVQIIAIDQVPEHFAGWTHLDDLGKEHSYTQPHPGEPPVPAGGPITGALLPHSAPARYDALKAVVGKLKGAWEDAKGKLNLVGVKNLHDLCLISPKPDDWNDTLFACFLDDDGNKCALELKASLNPGTDARRAKVWHLWEGSWKFKLDEAGEVDAVMGEYPPLVDGMGLRNARFTKAKHKNGEEVTLLIDAPGLEGRQVKFIVEQKRVSDKEWKKTSELTGTVEGAACTVKVPAKHPDGTGKAESTLLRFQTALLDEVKKELPKIKLGKVLRPDGKVKAWFDPGGIGAPRAKSHEAKGASEAGEIEADFAAAPVQLAAATSDAVERLHHGTQLVWGGLGPSSPFGHLLALVVKAGGAAYHYLHGADLKENQGAVNEVAGKSNGDDEADARAAEPAPKDSKSQTPAESEKPPEAATVSGGDLNIPPAPPLWTAPGVDPKATGAALFGDPGPGVFWPVRGTKNHYGRAVCYVGVDGKGYGMPGGGAHGRNFLADRPANASKPDRLHVGLDLFADFHDLIVACETGTILKWHEFYRGVFKLLVKNESNGAVINYGEVDKGSLDQFKLKEGSRVVAGQPIAIAGKMFHDSMLHFEMYPPGTLDTVSFPKGSSPALLGKYLNPTQYLIALATRGR